MDISITNTDNVDFPLYDKELETIYEYQRRVEIFMINNKRKSYNSILDFLNNWLESDCKSISDFKNIHENKTTNRKHNKYIMKKYSKNLSNILNIKDYDPDSSILDFVKKILNEIDYSLQKKTVNDDIVYYIKTTTN